MACSASSQTSSEASCSSLATEFSAHILPPYVYSIPTRLYRAHPTSTPFALSKRRFKNGGYFRLAGYRVISNLSRYDLV